MASFTDNGQDVLAFPAGARGQPLGDGEAARLLAALPCWMLLAGVCDVLLAGRTRRDCRAGRAAVAGRRAAVGVAGAVRVAAGGRAS